MAISNSGYRKALQKIRDRYYANVKEIERFKVLGPQIVGRIEQLCRTAKHENDLDAINEVNVLQTKSRIIPHKIAELEAANEELLEMALAPFEGKTIGCRDLALGEIKELLAEIEREAQEEIWANLALYVPERNLPEAVQRVYLLTEAGDFAALTKLWMGQMGGISEIDQRLNEYSKIDEFRLIWDRRHDGAGKQVKL
jgi:hypothetical protein